MYTYSFVDHCLPTAQDPMVTFCAHPSLDEGQLHEVLATNRELVEIRLKHCKWIFPQAFSDAQFPLTLKRLDVSFTKINDIGIQNIFISCRLLQSLDISWCRKITNNAFLTNYLPMYLLDIKHDGTNIKEDDVEMIYLVNEMRVINFEYNKKNKREMYCKGF